MSNEMPRSKSRRRLMRAAPAVALAGLAGHPPPARAQEVVLRAGNAFQEGTYFSRNYERWIEKVNAEGKGLLQVRYVGGPKAIPTFELANAIRNGVVDLANTTTSFTAGVSPESLALSFASMGMDELRRNGALDYMNRAMGERNLMYYARSGEGFPYHVYLNKRIEKADLSGLKMRIAPIYRDFFGKLGATVVTIPPGEVYTALERGVVDGYGWPLMGIFDLGWNEKTKYRVEPGFLNVELGIIFNAQAWQRLSQAQRDYLQKQALWLEQLNLEQARADGPAELERQRRAGVEPIRLPDAEARRFVQAAFEEGWAGVLKASPQHGAKLKELMYRP